MSSIYIIVIISILGSIIGSFIGVIKKPSETFMYNMLSFAAGVMLSLSFMNLIPMGIKLSSKSVCLLGILLGGLIMYIVDRLIPHIHPGLNEQEQGKSLQRTSTLLILGMCVHHFPEGMAIAIGSTTDIKISIAVALAIAIHDIPEGICTSAPYYAYTNNKLKTFFISSLTAIPTLLGFFVSYYLYKFIPISTVGLIMGITAGLMIYICTDELIPSSSFKLTNHSTIFSFLIGTVLVMAFSL